MKKADIRLEDILTILSPSMIVRIMDESTGHPTGFPDDPEDITVFYGTAIKAHKELTDRGRMVKLINPEMETVKRRCVMHIYIY